MRTKIYDKNFEASVQVAKIKTLSCVYAISTSRSIVNVIPIITSGKARIGIKIQYIIIYLAI